MVQVSVRVRSASLAVLAACLVLAPATAARAATSIDGPVDLGTAAPYAVLAGSTVTNTGPSILNGDIGLSPGSSVTGFPPGTVNGVPHVTDTVAAQAQLDLTTAYNVAASLTPIAVGLGDLTGASLTPGVYSGGALSLSGALTLAGTAESVWVFQAASTLTIGSGAIITVTGGANACNVFWQVGTSATLDPGAQFTGTVMAAQTITAATAATITGRLLARSGAVTLDTNTITAPTGCAAGTVSTSPTMTSGPPPDGDTGAVYSHTITATGTPAATYAVSSGALPTGLTLDTVTGLLSGQPTTPGSYSFEITVSNGTSPDAVASYTVSIAEVGVPSASGAALAYSGVDARPAVLIAGILMTLGMSLLFYAHSPGFHRRPTSRRSR